jgi:alkanesulfonate monooxygenase SsuD/methylene tetrahydromethanopterin reductase-like flavin-dependent oxidoreductase (luciferase family)
VARFTEGLDLMKALWTRPTVQFDGEFWQLDDGRMEPKPFQKPHPPVWFGGSSPAALRRATRHGNGFFGAGSSPTAAFADQVHTVREELARAGLTTAEFPIAKRVYIGVGDTPGTVRDRVNAGLAEVYGSRVETIEAAAVAGTPEDCVRGLRAVADAGAERILLTTLFDAEEQMGRLASEVIPGLD